MKIGAKHKIYSIVSAKVFYIEIPFIVIFMHLKLSNLLWMTLNPLIMSPKIKIKDNS